MSTFILRRITDPAGTPTMSANISVPTTCNNQFPDYSSSSREIVVLQQAMEYLDALDDRLFAAHLRNGSLWTAHNIGVREIGVASTNNANRDAARWYEINNLNTTPTVSSNRNFL